MLSNSSPLSLLCIVRLSWTDSQLCPLFSPLLSYIISSVVLLLWRRLKDCQVTPKTQLVVFCFLAPERQYLNFMGCEVLFWRLCISFGLENLSGKADIEMFKLRNAECSLLNFLIFVHLKQICQFRHVVTENDLWHSYVKKLKFFFIK